MQKNFVGGIDTETASDDYETKLEMLYGKIKAKQSKNPKNKEKDFDTDFFCAGNEVLEYDVTPKDKTDYNGYKNRRKKLQDKDFLLEHVRNRYSIAQKSDTFTELLLRFIKEKDLKQSDCYNSANIDRRHFYKIKNDKYYMPTKDTVLAFVVALGLSYAESERLLKSAGYAFCENRITDIVVSAFVKRGIYDLSKINHVLYTYCQQTIGMQ